MEKCKHYTRELKSALLILARFNETFQFFKLSSAWVEPSWPAASVTSVVAAALRLSPST